jgi:hypothetical protein
VSIFIGFQNTDEEHPKEWLQIKCVNLAYNTWLTQILSVLPQKKKLVEEKGERVGVC